MVFTSCTGNFEKFNTDPNSAQDIDLTSLITTMQMDAQYPTTGETTTPVNRYQTGWNLLADHYAGYMACANHFDGGNNPMVYNLTANNWSNTVFEVAFTQVMPAWLQLKYGHDKGELSDEGMAVADILKVLTLHRASDMYGPLPVLHFGESRNPYDAQDVLYNHFFEVLDQAIEVLEEYVSISPDGRPLARVDAIYAGDFNKWLKFANSLKLRLAMRIRYAQPALAEKYASEAIAAGVITSVEDNAELKTFGSITINNPMEMIWNSYNDARMGASMDSYLNGYDDPRRAKMFQPSPLDGQFHGVRNGLPSTEQKFYTNMSAPNIQIDTPMRWLTASEVAFLIAEYELIYGSTASAQQYYEEGIYLSFVENGLSGGEADEYATRTNRPQYFTDASENPTKYNTSALGTVDIAWKNDGNELERIITQKWIAIYPNGMEAWAEFRRTGFPKIFPIQQSSSDPSVNKNTQIRRMVFPKIEYANNAGAVNAAARLLESGQDNGGTKLWWDKK
ncbi:MAG: SusD/RagB family nutrient-binding outer membrane lipoprotein [Alistipes sp.]|nr:SusD/RagB family nutrient-binding outer membrane lipoprotein [Alistipes sp.]